MHFEGCQCVIGDKDPNEVVKLHAQGLVLLPTKKVLTVVPNRFSAFVGQMPNRRLAIFGLAEYPEVVLDGNGNEFHTNFSGRSAWYGTVATLRCLYSDAPSTDQESHRLVVNTLRHACHLGMLKVVEDSTGCFSYNGNGMAESICD